MFYNPRNLLYSDVVALPATKEAGAITYISDVISLPTMYKAALVLMAADLSKVTNNVVVTVKGSFDGGTNWVNLGVYTDVANGSGTLSVKKEVFYAPVMKVEVAFDATGALTSGHGVELDLALVEDAEQTVKAPVADVVTVPATVGAATTTNGTAFSASDELPFMKKLYIVSTLDSSKATLVTQTVEGSLDGSHWYSVTISDSNITDANINFAETSTFVGKYARVNVVTGADTGALTSGHGVKVNVVACY